MKTPDESVYLVCTIKRREVSEVRDLRGGSHDPVIIHCYGHGGAGVTLHWGCVMDIADLVRDALGLDRSKL